MPTVRLTRETRDQFQRRIERLAPDAQGRWGSLTPVGMLAHLRRSVEISLEEVPVKDESNLFSRTLMLWLAFHAMPTWPKGKIKAPEVFTPAPELEFAAERARLLDAIDRFLEAQEAEPRRRTLHPAFGRLTMRYWGHVHGRHMRHHFEQFGI